MSPSTAPWRFTRAIQRAMDWLRDHDAADCTDLLTRYWPKLPLDVLIASVDDLKRSDVWSDVLIDPDGFHAWMTILAGEWLLDAPLDYHSIVDDRPARAALAQAMPTPASAPSSHSHQTMALQSR